MDVVLSAHSLWVDVVVTVVVYWHVFVCVVMMFNCGRILFSILYILSLSESWSYLTILSILLSFSVVKLTSGGRNHLKSHARAAFCCCKTRTTSKRRAFWRRMQQQQHADNDRQTDRQTADRQIWQNRQTLITERKLKFVNYRQLTNIDRTFCLIITKRLLA